MHFQKLRTNFGTTLWSYCCRKVYTVITSKKNTYNLDQEKSLLTRGRKAVFVCDWKKMSDYGKCLPTGTLVRELFQRRFGGIHYREVSLLNIQAFPYCLGYTNKSVKKRRYLLCRPQFPRSKAPLCFYAMLFYPSVYWEADAFRDGIFLA